VARRASSAAPTLDGRDELPEVLTVGDRVFFNATIL
jgi:hypothetical protein